MFGTAGLCSTKFLLCSTKFLLCSIKFLLDIQCGLTLSHVSLSLHVFCAPSPLGGRPAPVLFVYGVSPLPLLLFALVRLAVMIPTIPAPLDSSALRYSLIKSWPALRSFRLRTSCADNGRLASSIP